MSSSMVYEICAAEETKALVAEVTEAIGKGWSPHGGPFVFGNAVCQALVRHQEAGRVTALRARKSSEE